MIRADIDIMDVDFKHGTMVGRSLYVDGKVAALFGLMIERDCLQAFGHVLDAARPFPIAIYKTAKALVDEYGATGAPIYAEASEFERNAPGFLKRLGFTHCEGSIYKWR